MEAGGALGELVHLSLTASIFDLMHFLCCFHLKIDIFSYKMFKMSIFIFQIFKIFKRDMRDTFRERKS